MNILNIRFNKKVISVKRKNICNKIINDTSLMKNDIGNLNAAHLYKMIKLYDQAFLNAFISDNIDCEIKTSISHRMTKSAGKTITKYEINRNGKLIDYEIRIGISVITGLHLSDRRVNVAGITVTMQMEALQLILEHEICHIIETHITGKTSCRGKLFKALSYNLFRHTQSIHQLPSSLEKAMNTHGLQLGDNVNFNYKSIDYSGIITAITKRATIMSPDKNGTFIDKKGNRYLKYYIPLDLLNKEKF